MSIGMFSESGAKFSYMELKAKLKTTFYQKDIVKYIIKEAEKLFPTGNFLFIENPHYHIPLILLSNGLQI